MEVAKDLIKFILEYFTSVKEDIFGPTKDSEDDDSFDIESGPYEGSVFCIFRIEKFKIKKKIFSKGYFIIRLCTFMASFEVIVQKMIELWSF